MKLSTKKLLAITIFVTANIIFTNAMADDFQQQTEAIHQLIINKKYDEANQKLNNLLTKNSNTTDSKNAKLLFLQGLLFTETNRTEDAIKVFTQITQFYPELPEPYNNLAVLYAQQNQLDKAKDALEMAIQTHPAYATAYENLGDVYIRLANQAYDKALQLKNNNSKSLQNKLQLIKELSIKN